jgi:hypothetical protein
VPIVCLFSALSGSNEMSCAAQGLGALRLLADAAAAAGDTGRAVLLLDYVVRVERALCRAQWPWFACSRAHLKAAESEAWALLAAALDAHGLGPAALACLQTAAAAAPDSPAVVLQLGTCRCRVRFGSDARGQAFSSCGSAC